MGKIVIEFEHDGKLPNELVKALTKEWNVHRRGVSPKLGDGRVICSRSTWLPILDLFKNNGVRVAQVVVFEHGGSTKTIRLAADGRRQVAIDTSANAPWRVLMQATKPTVTRVETTTVEVYQFGMSGREKKAEQGFLDKLNGLKDQGLREGLYGALTTIVEESDPALEEANLRGWHLVHFPRKKDTELTPAVLLRPLEDKAPGLFSAAVGYAEAYQQGLGTYTALGRDLSDRDAIEEYMSPILKDPQDLLETAILEVMLDDGQLQALGSLAK